MSFLIRVLTIAAIVLTAVLSVTVYDTVKEIASGGKTVAIPYLIGISVVTVGSWIGVVYWGRLMDRRQSKEEIKRVFAKYIAPDLLKDISEDKQAGSEIKGEIEEEGLPQRNVDVPQFPEADPAPASAPIFWQDHRKVMQLIISVVVLSFAMFLIWDQARSAEEKNWAFAAAGGIVGFWLK